MLDEKEILHYLVVAAQQWKHLVSELARLKDMEPRDCRWRHWLPVHMRGYGRCHRDWQEEVDSYRQMAARERHYAMGLAHAVGEPIHAGWEPEKYASMRIVLFSTPVPTDWPENLEDLMSLTLDSCAYCGRHKVTHGLIIGDLAYRLCDDHRCICGTSEPGSHLCDSLGPTMGVSRRLYTMVNIQGLPLRHVPDEVRARGVPYRSRWTDERRL